MSNLETETVEYPILASGADNPLNGQGSPEKNGINEDTPQSTITPPSRRYSPFTTGLNAMDRVCSIVNKLPFSGKLLITPVVLAAAKERDIYTREISLASALGLIGFVTYAHFNQAGLGVEAFQNLTAHQNLANDPTFYFRAGHEFRT